MSQAAFLIRNSAQISEVIWFSENCKNNCDKKSLLIDFCFQPIVQKRIGTKIFKHCCKNSEECNKETMAYISKLCTLTIR